MKKEQLITENFFGISVLHLSGSVPLSFWEDVPHSHDHCEIFIHIKGTLDIFVEKNLYHVTGNEVRIYRSGELHCGKSSTVQEMEWYQISIPRSFFSQSEYKPLSAILFDREAGNGNVFISENQEEILCLLKELFALHAASSPLFPAYYQGTVLRILCLLNAPCSNRHIRQHQDEVLQQIIHRVNTDFQEIASVQDLCRLTHYSASYLHRLFRQRLNITPYQWIIGKKLNEAKKVLWEGASVTEACDFAGFNNYNNFITLFKRTFGITPKKYREQHSNNQISP